MMRKKSSDNDTSPLEVVYSSPQLAALLYRANHRSSDAGGRPGIVTLHGSEGSAVTGINTWLAPRLADRGYTVLAPSKRNSGRSFFRSIFDWCLDDIGAALDFFEGSEGQARTVLIGHSLGAAECVYYQGKTHDRRVSALVLMGAPIWPRDIINPKKLRDAIQRAAGAGREGGGSRVSASESYISYWGECSNSDIRKWIRRVDVPILNIAHGEPLNELCNAESSSRVVMMATTSPSVTNVIIDKASHSFTGHHTEAVDAVCGWIEEM